MNRQLENLISNVSSSKQAYMRAFDDFCHSNAKGKMDEMDAAARIFFEAQRELESFIMTAWVQGYRLHKDETE